MPASSPSKPAVRRRVIEIAAGDPVDSIFLLAGLDQRTKKNGDPYFFLTVRDSSGSIQGVMWDGHDLLLAGSIRADDFVRVEGQTTEFNGALQLTVRRISRVEESEVDISDFLAVSPRPRADMERELDALIAGVRNRDCRRLLERLLNHPRLRDLYCTAPAAARIHQAYIGGLLEHTLNVVRNAVRFGEDYGPYDRDLLVTGGLLHDIGKIREYDWRRTITYTDEGRLMGHISIGSNMVDGAIRQLQREPDGFADHYHTHILHLILSHHGKLEYGSPTVPKTKEALLLHYGDYTDAYLSSYCELMVETQAKGQMWTGYNKMFDAYLYAGPPTDPGKLPSAADVRSIPPTNDPGGFDPRSRPEGERLLDDVVK